MKKNHTPKEEKEICASLFKMFGDRWSLRVVDALRDGELRFKELQERLGINSATLTLRLRSLEKVHVLIRRDGGMNKLSVSYHLTTLGRELLPIYDGILKFGKKVVK